MNCLHCQQPLISKDSKKFCSSSCSAKHNNAGRRRHSKPYSKSSTVKPCRICGKESKNFYCSVDCNPRRLKLTEEEKKKRSLALHNEAWHRYQAKKKNQTPLDVNIKELQEFYANCPIGYEVDHIIPISKGGLHCIDNLQYLTISENRKKSNKILA